MKRKIEIFSAGCSLCTELVGWVESVTKGKLGYSDTQYA